MIQAFAANLIEAFTAPRLSARRIMAVAPGPQDCFLMVVLAFAIQALVGDAWALTFGAGEVPGFTARLAELMLQVLLYVILVAGVHGIGRRFGGTASQPQVAAVVAWHYLVSSLLSPLNVLGMSAVDGEGAGVAFLLVPLSVSVSIWLFASFVAEAHGFRRLGGVILASVGGFAALGFIAMLAFGLFAGAPR
ncbi:MAG: hypothetical protein R6V44_17795 [Paracoccaceae bacterium]